MKVRDVISALEKCPPGALVISGNMVKPGQKRPVTTEVLVQDGGKLVKIRTHNYPEAQNIPPITDDLNESVGERDVKPT